MAPYFARAAESLVSDALEGFARAHPGLVEHVPEGGFVRALHTSPARRVGLLSGGGSGHEPLHIGFVGAGMLDAACPGMVFSSPHNRQVFTASMAVAREDGVLHLVKNYTGDKINFGIAAERLADEGIAVARVLVDDDVASESEDIAVGRRGTGGAVLVEKILGAAADEGTGLLDLADLGTRLAGRCRSIAVASAAHTAPGDGARAFDIPVGQLEFGVGIHGERANRTVVQEPLDSLLDTMAESLLGSLPLERGESVIGLVNGLGAVTGLELYAIARELGRVLDTNGVELRRSLVGHYVTALDMRGFSLTLLSADDAVVNWFDAPAQTAAWCR
ncbi:dihydroxyacetone kinase subunit DhaK [Streptomyces zingiberis]|uniref:Dihydroxyacetone kinase subunit DhaK n=1 Tax=Streptomyces zingiberis TaxID=2053010 RepID=A0ABX1BV60_9ACTN|nr:dihydroxyacetone kinase subunit DhaK [Streptomyces zingiberis]NJQ01592.1 dihydroxyacetone kinase subunit DhaK [Streptomyces zingiberis]